MFNTVLRNLQKSNGQAPPKSLRSLRTIFLCLLWLLPVSASALPEDSEQPVEINADRTEFDNAKQRHTLSGNVEISQGSMRISAELITLQLKDGEISEINGKGKPLQYSITDNDGKPLQASARQIIYRPIEAKLSLLGDASLTRPDRQLSGERIDYDINTAHINAIGNKKQRVKITIQPEKKK